MFESSANFDCDIGISAYPGIPQTFDLDIELKGNFTFSWSLAFESVDIKALCGEHFFIVKELVRRTHFGAIPVAPLNDSRFFRINNSKFDPQLTYIYNREIDLSLDRHTLNSLLVPFMNFSHSVLNPSVSLMGGFYRNTKSNSFFSVANVFSTEIWILILLTLFISPILLAMESLIIVKKKRENVCNSNNNFQEYCSEISRMLRKHLWIVCNAMFMPSFRFKYLNRLTFIIIIGFLLVFKILNSTLFSSEILSVTINDPYYVIDSIKDFNNRSDLEPILYVPSAFRDELEKDNDIKHLTRKVKEENLLAYDFQSLFAIIDSLITKICIHFTHILLISPSDANLIISLNKNKFKPITHISKTNYFDEISGFVFHKELDPWLKKIFNEIIRDSSESGLPSKTVQTGLITAYKLFGDKNFIFELEKQSFQMELDEIKVALGPFIIGICLAFLALLWEHSNKLKENAHPNKY